MTTRTAAAITATTLMVLASGCAADTAPPPQQTASQAPRPAQKSDDPPSLVPLMAFPYSTSNVSGTVITFDGSKGLGFIRADGSEEWIRFTTKDIVDGGGRGAVERNQPVRFDIVTSSVGLAAINVSFADAN